MKFFIIFAMFFLAVAYADLAAERADMRKKEEECEKTHTEPKNMLQRIRNGETMEDMEKARMMALCINVGMGIMNEDGTMIMDKFKSQVERLTDDVDMRKRMVEKCGVKNGNTPEEAAWNFMMCMKGILPDVI